MTTNLKHHVPPLQEDLSNWITYKKRATTAITSHGLGRHLSGTVRTPKSVTEISGDYYVTGNPNPLTDDEYDKLMEAKDKYDTKEAQLCDILYQTIPNSLFLRIKDEQTANDVWKKMCSIIEDKSPISIDSLHNKMMNLRTPESGDIRETLTQLQVWYEELAGMSYVVPEDSYMTYIRQSCGAPYRDLFKSLAMTSELTGAPLSSQYLIDKARQAAIEREVEKEDDAVNTALAVAKAASLVPKGSGSQHQHSSKGGKVDRSHLICDNCGRTGHMKPHCWAPGGGCEGKGPKQKSQKGKKKQDATAAAAQTPKDDEEEEYAFVMDAKLDDDVSTPDLRATSDFQEKMDALATAQIEHNGEVIDTGASRHFSPIIANFKNLVRINPSPVTAADGRSFVVTARGDYMTSLPMGPGKKPTPITLTNTYYSPSLAPSR